MNKISVEILNYIQVKRFFVTIIILFSLLFPSLSRIQGKCLKIVKYFGWILITVLTIFFTTRGTSYGANLNVGEPRTVRMIYFLPNDRPFRANVVQKMKDDILNAQTFYAEQMQAGGYGNKTFQFETTRQGEPKVHRVNGKHPFSYYDNTLGTAVVAELEQAFDLDANIYFIVLGAEALRQGNGLPAGGVGSQRGKNGGHVVVPNEFTLSTMAHELGHTFGLGHDFRDDSYLMSYGHRQNLSLSACAAEFLSLHSYFNPRIPIVEGPTPTIELISSPTYPADSKSIPVRLKVKDSEGIHQVQLFAWGGLQGCRGLAGKKEAVVEFEYDGGIGLLDFDSSRVDFTSLSDAAVHNIFIVAVDTDGNVGTAFFTLAEISPHYITTFEGHTERVRSLAFSPDGQTLASVSFDKMVKLWNISTETNIATFKHTRRVKTVMFSPDGTTLASGGNDGIKLWDLTTERNIVTLSHGDFVNSLSFSPDGTTLASGGDDWTVKLWDLTTGHNIATMTHDGDHGFVNSLSFSPDGTTLASGSWDGEIKLWDVATGSKIDTLTPPVVGNAPGLSLSFSPDGTTLASGSWSGEVKLWDVATKRNIVTLSHAYPVNSVSFSPDGRTLASGSWSGEVKLWDVATGYELDTFGHTSDVLAVTFSPDGTTLASGTFDGVVKLWNVLDAIAVSLINVNSPVTVPDTNLRAKIAETLGKPVGVQLIAGDMLTLTELYAPNANIQSLTGLEHAHNLRKLDLGGKYIEGEGNINSNTISDFSPIAGLTRLTQLNLSSCSISDVSFLSDLTRLTTLELYNNPISDMSALSSLTQLTHLNLSNCAISDVSFLSDLTQLTTLRLYNNPISDIAALADLTQLTFLELSETTISDVSALSGLAQLTSLYLGWNDISDISVLTGLTQLRDLHLSGNEILDVSPLAGLTQLTYLYLGWNDISDISALSSLTQLKYLYLGWNTISDMSALSGLTQLEVLDLRNNEILDVSPLVGLDLPGTQWNSTGLYIERNPLNYASVHTHIPAMQAKGVEVQFDNRAHSALVKISGDTQESDAGRTLATPFVVEAIDPHGVVMTGISVRFRVIEGAGRLSSTTVITDADGRAETTLTLGASPGVIKVRVTAAGITYPVTFTAIATEASRLATDVNGDGIVNIQDLVLVAGSLGQTGQSRADVNGDGIVNIQDLVLVAGAFGEGTTAAPTLHPSDLEGLTAAEVQDLLTQARQMALTDPAYLRGIAMLEQLLALLLPKETALLPNYPNPFNPETWIPYQLAESVEVTLNIYAVNGALVRTLALGHQPIGKYYTRSRAAYWDGRNSLGETIASGIYFYTLIAGDFTATRKMLIRK